METERNAKTGSIWSSLSEQMMEREGNFGVITLHASKRTLNNQQSNSFWRITER